MKRQMRFSKPARRLWRLGQVLRQNQDGATAVEYALIAAFICIAIALSYPVVTGGFSDSVSQTATKIRDANK